ncbi:Hpt domain-containing protein [Desulfovibrio psychrotolerans]|uniref:Hpt domain-containing protein n=1 Tax=Desulfovibrio psychrotolerans TaxID=415242 RepID=UPI00157A78C7|nr:Hpt domain-containing protein [Desulfovibrio psychrotolerans]
MAFCYELDVWVLDPVMGNRMLLAGWVRAEADNLDMRCRFHAVADAGELGGTLCGLILASDAFPVSSVRSLPLPEPSGLSSPRVYPREPGAPDVPGVPGATGGQETHGVQGVLCVYAGSETGRGESMRLSEGPVRLTWPVPRRMLRRLMAAAVAVVSQMPPAGFAGPAGPALFGHPLPAELREFSGRLRGALQELHEGCAAALQGGDCAGGERTAHTLKGTAMSFGQLVLAEAADALQDAFAAEDTAEAAWWLDVLARLGCAGDAPV